MKKEYVSKSVNGMPLPDVRWISAKYSSVCPVCKTGIAVGDYIGYNVKTKKANHVHCTHE